MKSNIFVKTAIAAAFGLASLSANAGTVAFATPADYAVEGVPASGAVTIPAGIAYSTAAGAAESGLLTITLPAGVTFVSTPSITPDGVGVTAATVGGGGAGSNTLTINYTRIVAAQASAITLGAFQVTGATALSSPTAAGAFRFTAQSSGFATAANNDAAVLPANLATSSRQLIVTPAAAALTINVPTPSNATRWLAGGTSIAGAGSVGTLVVNNGVARNAANTAAFAFTGATATATISGNFSNVTGAYLAAGAGACAATVPAGAITGTVTATSVTFAGIAPAATLREVCLLASGSNILQQTPAGVTVAATQDTFTTSAAAALGTILYNGGVTNLNYVVGSGSGGYSTFLRVVNRNSAATDVRVVVQKDAGTVVTGLLANMPANSNRLFTVAEINTATGAGLNSETDRAAMTVLSPFGNVTSTVLMLNPNATVVGLD